MDPASALWGVLEALPVERSHLLLATTWTMEHSGWREDLSAAIRDLRTRFDHIDVVLLVPSRVELEAWNETGLPGLHCSHNAFLREDYYFPIPGRRPMFDAIYDGMWADVKRHHLAAGIRSLALIAFPKPEASTADYSRQAAKAVAHATWFTSPWQQDPPWLSASEVNDAYNQARVGLCLSEVEGANFATVQYLLAGLPVVTTRNLGGRDEFLSDRVARWVEDDPEAVATAVAELAALDLDPALVRAEALTKISEHRQRLLDWMRSVIDAAGRLSRWHDGWPPDLPNKFVDPPCSVRDLIGAVSARD